MSFPGSRRSHFKGALRGLLRKAMPETQQVLADCVHAVKKRAGQTQPRGDERGQKQRPASQGTGPSCSGHSVCVFLSS